MAIRTSRVQQWTGNLIKYVVAISKRITVPAANIEPRQRRRSRLLSAFLLVMTATTLIGSISLKSYGGYAWIIMAISSASFLASYFISRTKYFRLTLILSLVIPAIPPVFISILQPPELNLTTQLMWLSLPLLIAGLLLTVWQTIVLAICDIILVIIFAVLGILEIENTAPLMAYLVIATFIVSAIAVVRKTDQVEIESNLTRLLQVEQTLRESEEKFSKAFHASPDAISISTLDDGKFIEINQSYYDITGYSREEVISHNVTEFNMWVNPKQREKMLQKARNQERLRNEEYEFRSKSGEIQTMLISTEYIQLSGRPCVLLVASDITVRKRIEKTLRESREKFSKAFNASPQQILITRARDNKILEANDSYLRANNLTRNETVSHTAEPLGVSVALEDTERLIQMLTKNKPVHNEEVNYYNKSGEIRTGLISLERITIGDEECWISIITDISERKRMEEALKESEDKFSKVFYAIPDTISISTVKDGIFLDVNSSFLINTGHKREEVIGKNAKQLKLWGYPEGHDRLENLYMDNGHFREEELEFLTENGERHTLMLSADTINIRGEPCMLLIGNDITERKKRDNLQKAENYIFKLLGQGAELNILLDAIMHVGEENDPSIKCTILVYDSQKKLLQGSGISLSDEYNAALKIGFPPGPIAGSCGTAAYRKERIIVPDISKDPLFTPFKEAISLANKNGLFACWSQPLISSSGELLGTIANYSNHTGEPTTDNLRVLEWSAQIAVIAIERKQAEDKLQSTMFDLERSSAQLRATNKELESFSYSVSHDLRSPLRSIDGFSQALLEDYKSKLDETGKDYLNRLRGASQKMGELIDGILKLSRLTRNEIHREKVDLSALAEEISGRLTETYLDRTVKTTIDSGLYATGDPQMLRVLLENLLGNAWKFTGKTPNPQIEFSSINNNGLTTFFIKDNGAGFDMAFKDKLFGAFQRLHDSMDFPGTGIGLATVQRIINRHGGTIYAEGAVGKGATFYFTLP
jgi:PAS domain S-box-containing protein